MEKISRQDVIDYLWERRANEYELHDDREEFSMDDIVTFIHKRPIFNNELHEVQFKLEHMLGRSITCPICDPKSQHDYGVNVLRKYLKEKLQLNDEDIEERAIESDGHVFDFLVYGNTVIHYFDSSYFINFTRESEEMLALMAEFVDSDEYDLVPVTYTDIRHIENGGDLIIFPEEDDEEDYE
jgi:hypothetical protein